MAAKKSGAGSIGKKTIMRAAMNDEAKGKKLKIKAPKDVAGAKVPAAFRAGKKSLNPGKAKSIKSIKAPKAPKGAAPMKKAPRAKKKPV